MLKLFLNDLCLSFSRGYVTMILRYGDRQVLYSGFPLKCGEQNDR